MNHTRRILISLVCTDMCICACLVVKEEEGEGGGRLRAREGGRGGRTRYSE